MKPNTLKLYTLISFLLLGLSSVFSQTSEVFSPTFSHLSGRYNTDIKVQLTTSTPNSTIYFTLNGADPDSSSQKYTGEISIGGNGNYVVLKAITIHSSTQKSLMSSSIYMIDYSFNPQGNYLTNLSWEEYNDFIVGDWFGYASTPWTYNYSVKLSILPNGNYRDETTTRTGMFSSDYFGPVFYYGTPAPSDIKKIEVYDVFMHSGFATGFITIDFGRGSTNRDELRYIKFMDKNNLYLEMWHAHDYGPLKYYLTKRNESVVTSATDESHENISVYPNPASDFLSIKNLNSKVRLIHQQGQSFLLEKSDMISVSHLPRGLYLVSFENTDKVEVKQKVILE